MIPRFSPNYSIPDIGQCFAPSRKDAVTLFEHKFAERACHEVAIAFKYGRSGLYYLLKALGAQGKKVIMPAYTCVVVAHAIAVSGNIPVFLDNKKNGFQPDPMDYLNAIDDDTVMIIPTHLFGIAEETSNLYREVKKRHPNVFILQDCAHGYFCQDTTGKVVTEYGDGAIFGMNISKLVNSVKGGMLTLQDKTLAKKVKKLHMLDSEQRNMLVSNLQSRLYAMTSGLAFHPLPYELVYYMIYKTSVFNREVKYYHPEQINLPFDFKDRMSNFEAEIGLRSLQKYDRRINKRQDIAKFYIEALSPMSNTMFYPAFHSGYTWSHFPLVVPSEHRDKIKMIIEHDCRTEIGVIVDYSIPDLSAYQSKAFYHCPNASELTTKILNLPLCFQEGLFPKDSWQKQATTILQLISQLLLSLDNR